MLYETITNDMKEAMKAKDKDSLNTLRLLKSAIDLYLVNNKLERNNASDEVVIDVVAATVVAGKTVVIGLSLFLNRKVSCSNILSIILEPMPSHKIVTTFRGLYSLSIVSI